MDRLNHLRSETVGSSDSTLDTTSPPSEAFITANESSSKYFSLSEVDSTFDISPIKDVSLASASADPERTITGADELISNLSPISKKSDILDSYKIGKQIEAANILSGGVDIFDDNENSYDGDELVIDDNVEIDDKSNPDLKQSDSIEFKNDENLTESTLMDESDIASKDTEVVLQIDGKNVDAINIGNGLYLYRKEGQEELAAVQIIDDDQQQPSFKFLKVRENTEGNLEVYEEIEIEVPKEVPIKEGKSMDKNALCHVLNNDIHQVTNDPSSDKVIDSKTKTLQKETSLSTNEGEGEDKDAPESKTEVNFNGKMMKFSESRKSPVIGTFTPMTYHSTPNKEGIPLTKTMVDMQLQPSRHSDNIKKTIEVHTDSCKQKLNETPSKSKDFAENFKDTDASSTDKGDTSCVLVEQYNQEVDRIKNESNKAAPNMDIIETSNIVNNKHKILETITDECVSKNIDTISDNPEALVHITDDIPEDKEFVQNNETMEKNKVVKTDLEIPLSNMVEKNKQDNKECDLDAKKIKSHGNNEMEDNKKVASVEIVVESTAMVKKMVVESSDSMTKDEKATSPKTTETMPRVADLQKEVTDENIIDTKNQNEEQILLEGLKLAPVVSTVPITSTEIPIPIEKALVEEQVFKKSDDKHVDLENSNVILQVEDEPMKNEIRTTEEHEKGINDKLVNENLICDKVEEKQVTPLVITKQISIPPENVKLCEKNQDEDVNPISTCDGNKLPNADAEIKPQKDIEVKQITKPRNIVPDIKQFDLANKEKQIENQDDNKIAFEKQITTETNVSHDISRTKNTSQKAVMLDKTEEIKTPPFEAVNKVTIGNNKAGTILNIETTKNSTNKPIVTKTEATSNKPTIITDTKKEISKTIIVDKKTKINNNAAVPFGKWTEANRQEFLNKIKETKVPVNISNSKPIKNSNDLNRRDVLKKIDSQRQSNNAATKVQESSKINTKNENVFTNKPIIAPQDFVVQNVSQDSKIPVKVEMSESKNKTIVNKKPTKKEVEGKAPILAIVTASTVTTAAKKEFVQRKAVNAQDLIDKTVEGMINKGYPPKLHTTEVKSNSAKDANAQRSVDAYPNQASTVPPTSLDAIEMKMNELHGIPFIERPPHELPRPNNPPFNNFNKVDKENPTENKATKIPNLLPFSNKNVPKVKENVGDVDSEEEIIEHEPVTGDIEITRKGLPSNLPLKEKMVTVDTDKIDTEPPNKETIITENDFDKFARRNSVTYENCITVSFDGKEQHNVIQTVVEKDILKAHQKNDILCIESKPKLGLKLNAMRQNTNPSKHQPVPKIPSVNEDTSNKNYQSKLQLAYQTALTAKRHKEGPITVIEDKPVKVVYMDANQEYIPSKLNVQGQNLSPAKKPILDLECGNTNACLDTDITDSIDDNKIHDESKPKTKHQRKQVLTPVEAPELELIEPGDLGIEVSPKKKRKTEDARDKNTKNVIHKKSYLLGRSSIVEDKVIKPLEITKSPITETIHRSEGVGVKETVTALDNLVKAAELLENQSESMNLRNDSSPDSQPSTPVKRGRGRPRKYPLPEGTVEKVKVPSPQKKPRLIDAKPTKRDTTTEEEESSDEEIVKENWTMGKINENIVCPICNKLFRSENVVFKHVKHCTGPSPNRSDTDKRSSSRRGRQSQESDSKSDDMDIDEEISKDIKKYTPNKRGSKDSSVKSDMDEEDIIVIEDTPVKEKVEKEDDRKHHESRKLTKAKIHNRIVNNLVCEFCGKTFRQLSYLANHKLQHKKEEAKKGEKDSQAPKSVFSCDVCKKEFRKLHHLVQHRLIHNQQTVSSKLSRKSSSDQEEIKSEKEEITKQNDDPSAGFRCEPCDKSFRKLHHLVEHRETHDGINRQKGATVVQTVVEKPTPPPQCEICKKTFRKLHHLIEHKEQHLETSSEKSDDKSVKSSLSTKDIIHECPLCYMVFPNEHSLNKHSVICQRKKRQSKQPKPLMEDGDIIEVDENAKSEENKHEDNDEPVIITEEEKVIIVEKNCELDNIQAPQLAKNEDVIEIIEKLPPIEIIEKVITHQDTPKEDAEIKNPTTINVPTKVETASEIPVVIMKIEQKEEQKIPDVPKKKIPAKSKITTTVTKRPKINVPPVINSDKSPVETSDEDEVRYMLNPNLVVGDTSEGKVFMKVRAKKRNSLQIERPNSKDLIKRRTSLQHPPKIPRLKPKPIELKVSPPVTKNVAKTLKLESVPSTDSDDSDVKYSFPKSTPERTTPKERPSREMERKSQRKSLAEKRKTLSGIAKRKSLGKTAAVRHKETTSPPKQIKRRTAEPEHRCDCGQLFSSAALLARHTTLAHTPPRIRKRRSPPPDPAPPQPPSSADRAKHTAASRKPGARSDTSASDAKPTRATRTSSVKNDAKLDTRKSVKPVEKVEPKNANASNVKSRRSIATRTTVVPERAKKPTQKSKI